MKVAISGVGIAGPSLAYWLHRRGHEVVLVEKSPKFRTGGYVVDFWGVGYSVAQRMGILEKIRTAGYSVEELRIVDRHGRKVGGFPVDVLQAFTQDRFTSLPRGDLAAIIYQTIEGHVETLFDNSITAITQHETHALVSFQHGKPREFDLVVGADGLHSQVRELAFGSESQHEKHLGYHVAAFELKGYPHRDELVYVSYSEPGRQVARFALRDDRTVFYFIFESSRLTDPEPLNAEQRKAAVRQVFEGTAWECSEILRQMDQLDDIYLDRVSQIRMEKWSKGRVVLIGDAAACVSFLAGEGSGLAMTEAFVLAEELNRFNGDYHQAFLQYEQQLRPFIEKKQASALGFAKAFVPKTKWGLWFRNKVSNFMSIPPLAKYVVGRAIQDDFELPDTLET